MKKFRTKFGVFLLFPLLLLLVDLLSPLNAFTFRQWEALQYNYGYLAHGAFYPKQKISMTEYGDLGRHTPYQIAKHTTWTTDSLGFRNTACISQPDILLIGDSFFTGSSLSDDNTITISLKKNIESLSKKKYSVYNISPNSFQKFCFLFKSNIIQKPKVIVFSVVERSIHELEPVQTAHELSAKEIWKNKLIEKLPYQLPMTVDRIVKFNFLRWASVKINPNEWKNQFQAMNHSEKNSQQKMLFLKSANEINTANDTVSNNEINALLSYKAFCDRNGILFIFVPLPDKETVYYDRLTGIKKQNTFLYKLDTAIRSKGITSINMLEIFNNARSMYPNRLLYQYDDTHWNEEGVSVLAEVLGKKLLPGLLALKRS